MNVISSMSINGLWFLARNIETTYVVGRRLLSKQVCLSVCQAVAPRRPLFTVVVLRRDYSWYCRSNSYRKRIITSSDIGFPTSCIAELLLICSFLQILKWLICEWGLVIVLRLSWNLLYVWSVDYLLSSWVIFQRGLVIWLVSKGIAKVQILIL